jgi:acyl carrier protein
MENHNEIHDIILTHLRTTVESLTPLPFPDDVDAETPLQTFRLDSVAFTSLLVGLEQAFGFIPSKILQGIAYPQTVGELIEAYVNELNREA